MTVGGAVTKAVVMPERAVSVKKAIRVCDTGEGECGGPRLPVFVLQPMDLVEYGGAFKVVGGEPTPMRLSTAGRILGGPCIAVYPVLADGTYDAGWDT